jgi:hypothetical protein
MIAIKVRSMAKIEVERCRTQVNSVVTLSRLRKFAKRSRLELPVT